MRRTLSAASFALALVALVALVGCGSSGSSSPDQESQANADETVGTSAEALSVSKTLYFEGTCAWLRCTNHNTATGACGYGCSDTSNRIARDYSWRWSCGRSIKACHAGYCAYAKVWDQSCCGRMEGNSSLLSALHISHGSPTCGAYGYGSGAATFYY